MKKIFIFYGSNKAYNKLLPSEYDTLTNCVLRIDEENRKHEMVVRRPDENYANDSEEKRKYSVENLAISADEYSSVQEHVLLNFVNFISQLDVDNLWIQNPPQNLRDQLHRVYDNSHIITEKYQGYRNFTKSCVIKMNNNYDDVIIGQKNAKMKILKALFPLTEKRHSKPVVMLFYGDSGLGKTETANYISKLVGGVLFRKQFSMYQNSDFATYLFGGKYNEPSFAKDLLSRDSNVILLDEFDKANPVFHSAFYQLFDEGIFEDRNYRVNVENGIIVCTSNYKTIEEVEKQLGSPIYNRFDAVIEFNELSLEAKQIIAYKYEASGMIVGTHAS